MKEPNPMTPKLDTGRPQEVRAPQLPEILDGNEAKDLKDSARIYELASGGRVIAGTDNGVGYDHNEDRVVIVRGVKGVNFVAVVDGMGGSENGEGAAKILAQYLSQSPENITSAVDDARSAMERQGIGQGGAVFISARLRVESNEKFLDIYQSGDAKLIIIKRDGAVSFQSVDQSSAQDLVNQGKLLPDQALYDSSRNYTQAVSANDGIQLESYKKKVETGDMVLLMSDGISDNFTAEEIAERVKKEGLLTDDLFAWLSNATGERMKNAEKIVGKPNKNKTNSPEQIAILQERIKTGRYSDGYRSKPKPDNRALVILEIK